MFKYLKSSIYTLCILIGSTIIITIRRANTGVITVSNNGILNPRDDALKNAVKQNNWGVNQDGVSYSHFWCMTYK